MKNVGHDAFLIIDRDWTKSGNRGKADFVRDVVAQFSSVGCAAASENPVSIPGGNPALLFAVNTPLYTIAPTVVATGLSTLI